jgi:hypothetical protein
MADCKADDTSVRQSIASERKISLLLRELRAESRRARHAHAPNKLDAFATSLAELATMGGQPARSELHMEEAVLGASFRAARWHKRPPIGSAMPSLDRAASERIMAMGTATQAHVDAGWLVFPMDAHPASFRSLPVRSPWRSRSVHFDATSSHADWWATGVPLAEEAAAEACRQAVLGAERLDRSLSSHSFGVAVIAAEGQMVSAASSDQDLLDGKGFAVDEVALQACMLQLRSAGASPLAVFVAAQSLALFNQQESEPFVSPGAAFRDALKRNAPDAAVYLVRCSDQALLRCPGVALDALARTSGVGTVPNDVGLFPPAIKPTHHSSVIVPPRTTDPWDWRVEDVCRWLRGEMELAQYIASFQDSSIDGPLLLSMDECDFVELVGVRHPAHARKLASAAERLRSQWPVPVLSRPKLATDATPAVLAPISAPSNDKVVIAVGKRRDLREEHETGPSAAKLQALAESAALRELSKAYSGSTSGTPHAGGRTVLSPGEAVQRALDAFEHALHPKQTPLPVEAQADAAPLVKKEAAKPSSVDKAAKSDKTLSTSVPASAPSSQSTSVTGSPRTVITREPLHHKPQRSLEFPIGPPKSVAAPAAVPSPVVVSADLSLAQRMTVLAGSSWLLHHWPRLPWPTDHPKPSLDVHAIAQQHSHAVFSPELSSSRQRGRAAEATAKAIDAAVQAVGTTLRQMLAPRTCASFSSSQALRVWHCCVESKRRGEDDEWKELLDKCETLVSRCKDAILPVLCDTSKVLAMATQLDKQDVVAVFRLLGYGPSARAADVAHRLLEERGSPVRYGDLCDAVAAMCRWGSPFHIKAVQVASSRSHRDLSRMHDSGSIGSTAACVNVLKQEEEEQEEVIGRSAVRGSGMTATYSRRLGAVQSELKAQQELLKVELQGLAMAGTSVVPMPGESLTPEEISLLSSRANRREKIISSLEEQLRELQIEAAAAAAGEAVALATRVPSESATGAPQTLSSGPTALPSCPPGVSLAVHMADWEAVSEMAVAPGGGAYYDSTPSTVDKFSRILAEAVVDGLTVSGLEGAQAQSLIDWSPSTEAASLASSPRSDSKQPPLPSHTTSPRSDSKQRPADSLSHAGKPPRTESKKADSLVPALYAIGALVEVRPRGGVKYLSAQVTAVNPPTGAAASSSCGPTKAERIARHDSLHCTYDVTLSDASGEALSRVPERRVFPRGMHSSGGSKPLPLKLRRSDSKEADPTKKEDADASSKEADSTKKEDADASSKEADSTKKEDADASSKEADSTKKEDADASSKEADSTKKKNKDEEKDDSYSDDEFEVMTDIESD